MEGVVTRVGLQLLLEPASTAWIARGACVAAGSVYPAYATYKAVLAPKRPPPPGRTAAAASLEAESARDALLKYWAVWGLACAAERLLEAHIDRVFPYYPHAKLAFLLWLQLHNTHGASLLFDRYLVPHLCRYERKLDIMLEAGAQLAEVFYSTYAGPIGYMRRALGLAATQLAALLKWLAMPDDPPGLDPQQQQQQQQQQGGGVAGLGSNLRRRGGGGSGL
uniref:HVA22-like protein n=1 Tax=Tetradesmus obliquus TaxID=3088 RepID=A0A383WE30_TETOB|eukprot:jgi/Sobl393_1/9292/SZX75858.1